MCVSTSPFFSRVLLRCTATLLGLLLASTAALAQTSFTVTVGTKTDAHPNPGGIIGEAYYLDGVEGQELHLVRGETYTFEMDGVSAIHPFYLSEGAVGGGADVYSEGVTGNFATGDETLTFAVPEDAPGLLYYQCGSHILMGWRIYVTDPAPEPIALAPVATGFTSPVALAVPDDGSDRLFVVDQVGTISIITADGSVLPTPFLDLQDRLVQLMDGFDERGLLGLAFHPDYATNDRFYVYYSAPLADGAPDDFNHTSVVAEYEVSSDPDVADPASERILLEQHQPQFNHDGGALAFGPDGFLYISLGDGGGANDVGLGHLPDWYEANEGGNGQGVTDETVGMLGTVLRIDVDSGDPYGIPADNPFVGRDGHDEIYAYGFRNPWRLSFDQGGSNDLLVGDAGQALWEEVSRVTLGGNYGWNVKEGTHCFDAANPETSPADCPDTIGDGHPDAGAPLLDPVIEYAHPGLPGGIGLAVVGGHVYRGSALPELEGRYVFGDWSASFGTPSGHLLLATPTAEGLWAFEPLPLVDAPDGAVGVYVLAFGQDLNGEVYVLTTEMAGPSGDTGSVYRLAPGTSTSAEEPASTPGALTLETGFPNPFRSATTLRFRLAESSPVTVRVLDALGRHVATLADGSLPAGVHTIAWEASDDAESGIYFIQITAGGHTASRTVTLIK